MVFEFKLSLGSEEYAKNRIVAETAGKAKYDYYLYLQDGIWEVDFREFLKHVNCKKVGKAGIASLFGDYSQFKRMCELRGIGFAFQGMRVSVAGRMGTIVGANSSLNLDVVFDGKWVSNNCHPHYETIYFDNYGKEVANYCEKAG